MKPLSSYSLIKVNLLILPFPFHVKFKFTKFMLLIMFLLKEIRKSQYMNVGMTNVVTSSILLISVMFLQCVLITNSEFSLNIIMSSLCDIRCNPHHLIRCVKYDAEVFSLHLIEVKIISGFIITIES